MPAATHAQPILSPREAATAAAVQDLPGIGTWAGRYRLFGRQEQPQAAQQGQAHGAPAAASQQQQQPQQPQMAAGQPQQQGGNGSFGSFVVLRPGGFGGAQQPQPPQQQQEEGQRQRAPVYGSEQAQEEAWRWRFSRKWATEQQRYYEGEPGQPASFVSDDLEAMHFTQASRAGAGPGVDRRELGPAGLDVCGQGLGRPSWRALSQCRLGSRVGQSVGQGRGPAATCQQRGACPSQWGAAPGPSSAAAHCLVAPPPACGPAPPPRRPAAWASICR